MGEKRTRRRVRAFLFVALTLLGARGVVACGGKIDPDSLGSGAANVGAGIGDDATVATPPTPPPPLAPPSPPAADAGPAACGPWLEDDSGPPPAKCTCEPSTMGVVGLRVCQGCWNGDCHNGGFIMQQDYADATADSPIAHACDLRCMPFSTGPGCGYGAGTQPPERCSCDRAAMTPLAEQWCGPLWDTWDLVPWQNRCVLRCLGTSKKR